LITISLKKVYGTPLLLAVVTLIGLLAALIGDGFWDTLSWFCLGTPGIVIAWCFVCRRRPIEESRFTQRRREQRDSTED
jgi:hypothetical protein